VNRRELFFVGTWGIVAMCTTEATALGEDTTFLKPTRYINSDHPEIIAASRRLTSGLADDRAKAVAIFKFVRDTIRFGFAAGFYDQTASEVLERGIGFCNTKSTLFVALLRAAGIPARQVFVDIDARILAGLLDTGTTYVDHSYTEVRIGERWVAIDAYIVDPPLFRAAKARLAAEGRTLGYGVHANGTNTWNGAAPSFSQFNDDGAVKLKTRSAQIYADVGAFYAKHPNPWNKLSWPIRQAFGLLTASANMQADALRRDTRARQP
jgi:transglutaminase-like putative cysteine protease